MTNQTNKQIPAQSRSNVIKGLIADKSTQNRIMQLLGDPVKREKFSATLINVALDGSLATCSPESIVKSGLQAAELDLSLNKNMGLAYIVRYKKDAEFQIGYKGWQLLAKRAGIRLKVTPIYDCDVFEISSDGFDTTVKYIPNLDAQQSKEHLTSALQAVKEVLDNLEKGQRDENANIAYVALYDAYHKALNAVNDDFTPESKN